MKIEKILPMAEGPDRTAALAAWFQQLFPERDMPVLVGGAAVELYTGGAYLTGDLNFVGSVSTPVSEILEREGFRRAGRHWVHEEGRVFIELPARSLDPGDRVANLRRGRLTVRVIGPEELLIDRLAAWQFWGSEQDAVNAFLIWRANALDTRRLRSLAQAHDVSAGLDAVVAFRRSLHGEEPSVERLERWAKERP